MVPLVFIGLLEMNGASPALARKVWANLAPVLSAAPIYHLNNAVSGTSSARGGFAVILKNMPPAVLLSAIEATVKPGRPRSREVVVLEENLLRLAKNKDVWR